MTRLECGHPDTDPTTWHTSHQPGCNRHNCDCPNVCSGCCPDCNPAET